MTIMGYTCTCGKYTQFSAYVLAHWDAELDHVCPQCTGTNVLLRGEVISSFVNGDDEQENFPPTIVAHEW